jgi:hypothetical protein
VVTAFGRGEDLLILRFIGRTWLEESQRQNFFGYPPFAAVLFTPLALLSFDHLRVLWLGLNLAAAGLCLKLLVRLWGANWTTRTVWRLAAVFVSWAGFRATLRNGQLSLLITALVLGALLARMKKREFLSGALLGLSLSKYSLSFPFFLYFIWKREWKIAVTATLVPLTLSLVYSLFSGVSLLDSTMKYVRGIGRVSISKRMEDANTLSIKPLVTAVVGGESQIAFIITLVFALAALLTIVVVFRRRPQPESMHFAVLAVFALWPVYHRFYDSVICVIPAALLIGCATRSEFSGWRVAWLVGFALFALNIPGQLTGRFHLSVEGLSAHPLGFIGLHIERLIIFAMFWSLLYFVWKADPRPQQAGNTTA